MKKKALLLASVAFLLTVGLLNCGKGPEHKATKSGLVKEVSLGNKTIQVTESDNQIIINSIPSTTNSDVKEDSSYDGVLVQITTPEGVSEAIIGINDENNSPEPKLLIEVTAAETKELLINGEGVTPTQVEAGPTLPVYTEAVEIEITELDLIEQITIYLKQESVGPQDLKLQDLKDKVIKRIASLEKKLNVYEKVKDIEDPVRVLKWKEELFQLNNILKEMEL